ncbi:MAG: serine hydrolase domain-containing protein [Pedobacter sp.]|nr:serine hydrolase domain-containing protein [Pedobacter sp.]
MKKIFLSTIALLFFGQVFGQLNRAKLDSLFDQLEANNKWMGSAALSKDGNPIYSRTVGLADEGKRAGASSNYRIGSITKMFVATLTVLAIEEKKLAFEDKLAKYFPSVANADQITISHLLNHHSGIANFTNSPTYLSWRTEKKTHKEILGIISANPSDFEPGSKAAYSNSNYVLLGYILEKLYDKPLQKIVAEKITKPLGLKQTYIGEAIDVARDEVNSYFYLNGWQKQPETDLSIAAGAGAMVSNPIDLNRFITALFSGKLVSMASLAKMKALQDQYGYGMRQFAFDKKIGYGHNGGIDGFSSMLYLLPEDGLSVAITSNGNAYDNNKILIALFNAYYGKPFTVPDFKLMSLRPEDLDQYLGVYSAPNFPLKITISKKSNVMVTQATGQSPITMEATAKDRFEYSPAGIVLDFKPAEKQLILSQGGGRYVLTKE